jgi:transcriptional regulator with XRE-family HTH domain
MTPPPESRSLPDLLLEARIAAGLSQGALAAAVGVTQPAVWSWERGVTAPHVSRLMAIADTLDIDVADLAAAAAA